MEKLPKPLVALINSIVDEYEQFTWNSNYLGDKMRISLIWTRGELVNVNKSVKHKSRSNKDRDTKRLKTWQDKIIENTQNDDDLDTSDIESDSSEEDMSESCDENQQIDKVDLPLVAPVKVHIKPVTKVTQPVRVSINRPINNNNESPPGKRVCRSSICGTNECERVEIDDEIKTVASKSIITGNSPCNDSHYQKIVFNRRPEGDLVLGKIKKKDTIVICNITKQKINHVNLDTNKSGYEDIMYYINRFRDLRKTDDEEISSYVFHVPKLERYAEVHKLCPWCFVE
ncbi:Hypothetical predicted protein [Mytilus galloprovincialis]|uniref:Uncharacterized protein n=1 Tax=Mytilus galloprovincialis TaxID=29158 RepID=A0A8B6FWY5_MYTGA|nr:Hypothetical predicted protein [Mytilus galloprovincialis]